MDDTEAGSPRALPRRVLPPVFQYPLLISFTPPPPIDVLGIISS
jgi:hypothetical protein